MAVEKTSRHTIDSTYTGNISNTITLLNRNIRANLFVERGVTVNRKEVMVHLLISCGGWATWPSGLDGLYLQSARPEEIRTGSGSNILGYVAWMYRWCGERGRGFDASWEKGAVWAYGSSTELIPVFTLVISLLKKESVKAGFRCGRF